MSEHDLVIRGGSVVDGTGAPAFTADVAVRDGIVVEVGAVSGTGRQEIDADGAVVAPGFVDVHTHYDGQSTWDDRMQPSSWHGVTTAVMGNCGVGFAPVVPADHDRLIELMEGVEDIPGVALAEGLAWDWQSFPEYLDAVERRPHDIDLAAQVPHAAVRVRAMGARAAAHEMATGEEIALMAKLAAEGIEAGALGFSTSRTLNHKSISGELTPTYDAGMEELTAIAAAIGRTGKGVLQLVTDWDDDLGPDARLVRAMMEASGRPMSLSLAQSTTNPQKFREILRLIEQVNDDGYRLRAQVAARGIGIILGLDCTLNPFMYNPVWQSVSHLPLAEQAAQMASSDFRARVLAAQSGEENLTRIGGRIIGKFDLMFELADPPSYEPDPEDTVARRAARIGCTPEELAYDLLVADHGRGLLYSPFANYNAGSLDAVQEMMAHPYTVPGLSDGGAHVGTICDGSFPTTLLQHWVRDRDHGTFELPYIVARQSRATAELVGLLDRGLLKPGYKADVNVIDMAGLRLHKPEIRHDLPAGGRRMVQRVDGYRHTVVSGQETYRDGEAVGPLPGRLIRGAQPGPAARAQ
ncbi:amidohydrolase family protein [Rhodococcus sp. X156]|uniref:N-acyl-D-amino-acid deacylase family protein n=1 Tax=Rhodococcus sp. X156 TaxID=2499145 RepID=UPI000FDA314C|nr:amidohydrolase family protein [Rhodococcus sp. X156]